MIRSIAYFGDVLGSVFMNLAADRFGRRLTFMVSLYINLLGSLVLTVGGLASNTMLMILGHTVIGFGSSGAFYIAVILISDYSGDAFREHGLLIFHSFWTLGEMSLYLIDRYVRHWEYFMIGGMVIPLTAIFVVSSLTLVESPVFLSLKQRPEECLDSLNTIARWNGKPLLKI